MDKQSSALLSVPEFATALNITVACARRWILERRVATVKLGRLIRVPYSEVERLVNAGFRPARSMRG
jgi:excisionase family DNA binding protein